jgi:hypothetical protein
MEAAHADCTDPSAAGLWSLLLPLAQSSAALTGQDGAPRAGGGVVGGGGRGGGGGAFAEFGVGSAAGQGDALDFFAY